MKLTNTVQGYWLDEAAALVVGGLAQFMQRFGDECFAIAVRPQDGAQKLRLRENHLTKKKTTGLVSAADGHRCQVRTCFRYPKTYHIEIHRHQAKKPSRETDKSRLSPCKDLLAPITGRPLQGDKRSLLAGRKHPAWKRAAKADTLMYRH